MLTNSAKNQRDKEKLISAELVGELVDHTTVFGHKSWMERN